MNIDIKKDEYLKRISQRIKIVMEKQSINQATLLSLAEQHGYNLRQSTLSKILSDSSSMSITSIVQIANTLNIDLNDLFAESNSLDVRFQRVAITTPSQSRLIRRADSLEMRPYLNSYYTYFFPTPSSDEGILSGKLRFDPSDDKSKCIAKFSFETGKYNSQNKPIVKEYEGDLILSPTMSVAYCTLINEEIGEVSYIIFNYIPILYEELCCRVALVLTASAGSNRMPTAHRMILSKEEITPEEMEILKGQLYLNESEILISESGLEGFFNDSNLDPSFIEYFRKPSQNAKFLGLSPVPYYLFDESVIRSSFLKQEVKNNAINLIRQYSSSPKYNKVGSKCDELVYKFITNKNRKNGNRN
mgnify:CR=1 FL=1